MEFAILVTITGVLVVFSALMALSASIWLIGKILQGFSGKKKDKGGKDVKPAEASPAAAPAPAASAKVANTAVQSGIPGDVIAAISAAIAMMMGGRVFKVKSIRRADSRSAWASAGIAENTRSF